jgi:hypothetical protein
LFLVVPLLTADHVLNYVFYSNYKMLSHKIEFRRRRFRSAGYAPQIPC